MGGKNRKIIIISSMFLFGVCSCYKDQSIIEKIGTPLKIFVATDTHLLSNNLVSKEGKYTKDKLTSDGRVQEYDYQILESLINVINEEKPSFFIITGDLTFNGEKDSHYELVSMLNKIDKQTKVLVLPGNHDVYNTKAFTHVNENIIYTDSITDEEFKDIYKDYGYQNAISYDLNSLSYIYELDNKTLALMLDTNLFEFNYEFGDNFISGYLDEETLVWIENNLKKAQEENKKVISFSHHNLITHNELFDSMYTLQNNQELLSLFSKYNVKLNFSGHLHIKNNQKIEVDNKTIYDISNGSLLDYGNRYTELNVYDNCYEINSKKYQINIDGIENFDKYSFDVFYSKFYDKQKLYFEKKYESKGLELLDISSKINCYYFDGDYLKIKSLLKENRSLKRFMNSKKFEEKYIKSLIDVDYVDQNKIDIYF